MKNIRTIVTGICLGLFAVSCNFLDIVPDDLPTVDMIYNMRSNAEKQLQTLYGTIPQYANLLQNPGLECGDEVWNCKEKTYYYNNPESWNIKHGNQNANDPYMNYWSGGSSGENLFIGIRECNDFIDNIDRVPDMTLREKLRWKAEARVIKAYLHFWLMQLYGPIPFVTTNISVWSDPETMRIEREPVDDVVRKIAMLLDEAVADEALPLYIAATDTELGRITRPVALALKAKVLLWGASPLFNGNGDYPTFKNSGGVHLINPVYDASKWEAAALACEEAIDAAHSAGHALYEFNDDVSFPLSPERRQELVIRNTISSRQNKEQLWGLGLNYTEHLFRIGNAPLTAYQASNVHWNVGMHNPTLEVAEQFYTDNGIPIDEDPAWDFPGRYEVAEVPDGHEYYIETGARTAKLHYNREPRFYASLGFDRNKWFNMEASDDLNTLVVRNRTGEISGKALENYNITGYFVKKLVSYRLITTQATQTGNDCQYAFPIIRLSDLYLMYAEARNESLETPDAVVWEYIQKIRTKAGLDRKTTGLVQTWQLYSNNPDKPKNKEGMREIIRRERLIELAFEGHRFHDLRRWKLAYDYLNRPVRGWTVEGKEEMEYYTVKTIYQGRFTLRDYFWPIKLHDLYVNTELIQNPMWEK